MIEFADDTARINALNGGQIHAMSQLPKSQAKVIEATDGLALLNAETGAWRPFTMRIDASRSATCACARRSGSSSTASR